MSTVHNPTNFDPSAYSVVDYIDNQPPKYCGQPVHLFHEEKRAWEMHVVSLMGANRRAIHSCAHCGNRNVRYMTVVEHLPTKERVCFGCDCTNRLEIPNRDAFRERRMKEQAAGGAKRLRVWEARCAFVERTEGLAELIERAKAPLHQSNGFVRDVLGKLDQYGSISERQIEAVRRSLDNDAKIDACRKAEAARPKAPVQEGRHEVEGEILSTKWQPGYMGTGGTIKMLVRLDDGAKVWGTLPVASSAEKGDRIKFRATFQRSKDDPGFGFFKRPVLISEVQSEISEVQS